MHQSVDALTMSAYFHDVIVTECTQLLLTYITFTMHSAIMSIDQKAVFVLRMHDLFLFLQCVRALKLKLESYTVVAYTAVLRMT